METLHRTKSSSNPDLLSVLSSSHHQTHKRTNSATDLPSVIDAPAPLQSAPSFSIYANDPSTNDLNQELDTIYHDFSFGSEYPDPTEIRQKCGHNAVPLFLARGLGIDRLGSELLDVAELLKGKCPVSKGNGEENLVLDLELKRIVDEEPDNATALKDYARFLHQNKGDAKRAEEYYSRAILADPTDGEIMAQYAKLVWHQHADVERCLSYFEKAVQVSPENRCNHHIVLVLVPTTPARLILIMPRGCLVSNIDFEWEKLYCWFPSLSLVILLVDSKSRHPYQKMGN